MENLRKRGGDIETIAIIKAMYKDNIDYVMLNNQESREFTISLGVKRGYVLSVLFFAAVLDEAIKKAKKKMQKLKFGFWKMVEAKVAEMFSDDMAILADSEENLQYNLNILNEKLEKRNMEINIKKTKTTIR